MTKKEAVSSLIEMRNRLRTGAEHFFSNSKKDEDLGHVDKQIGDTLASLVLELDHIIVQLKPQKIILKQILNNYGKFTVLTLVKTDINYKVPTLDVLTIGLKDIELTNYPVCEK